MRAPATSTEPRPSSVSDWYAFPSAETPDWSRERCRRLSWKPSQQLLRALRDYASARRRGGLLGLAQSKVAVLRHRFWATITGADVPLGSEIEGGLLMPHPNGVVVHPEARLGPNCLLFQQVTIGTGPKPGLPELGGHVEVGPGAKILGGVRIGAHVLVGANAVVVSDVPEGSVVAGVPAVVKYRR